MNEVETIQLHTRCFTWAKGLGLFLKSEPAENSLGRFELMGKNALGKECYYYGPFTLHETSIFLQGYEAKGNKNV